MIDVLGTTDVVPPDGDLTLVAPVVAIRNGFRVIEGAVLTIIGANPCPNCDAPSD
ncbi:MAG: hypothetical protein HKO12_08980 [Woeseiaceae bacterium]|nr:hypothetical protein [Woeseiaceae bacterium]